MKDNLFKLHSPYPPRGDQPKAIGELVEGLISGSREQTLLGVTGSGKTFTIANVVAKVQKPTLVISHNKTLAAQLTSEFREFFPENAVEYFVSYYDYYQPEAYIATTDTYIEKDADINDEIDRLRHASTQALLRRRDVIVVASVSCIYGLGSPEDYKETILMLEKGGTLEREQLLRKLVQMQFERNDVALSRGKFRARGDVLEVWPADEEILVRVSLSYDEIARIALVHPVTSEVLALPDDYVIYPAKHFITPEDKMEEALRRIEEELDSRLQEFRSQGKLLEAQRLENKTRYDLEMLREIGYCSGIENYSRHLSLRNEGDPPATLLDYFPDDFLTVMDESHVTIPQLAGMYYGDRSRKDSLVTHGFRLPSAYDNRPLVFEEFYGRIGQVIFVSATPGPWEYEKSAKVVEQIIRPTGLVDPDVSVRPSKNQIDDLISEIREREKAKERVLVTTLTKRMAEDLTDYLLRAGIRVRYLHSEVDTLDRIQILRDLRLGAFDVLVGINLLREGLDLPEVSLVAILDADKEGFLRSETTLIQTMGRAARNVRGQVIMYADSLTNSMKRALNETKRRRDIQKEFNQAHNITPESVTKAVRDILEAVEAREDRGSYKVQGREKLSDEALSDLLKALDQAMREAAKNLEFEKAAALRDEMWEIKKEMSKRGGPSLLAEEDKLVAALSGRRGRRKVQ